MKFGSLRPAERKSAVIRNFSGGIDLSDLPEHIAENALSDCKNIIYGGGVLSSRPGLSASADSAIRSEIPDIFDTLEYRLIGDEFYINGKYMRIAVAEKCYSDANHYCFIYLVDAEGVATSAGHLNFDRISNNVFYRPVKLLFYTGKPQQGGGIYVLVSIVNQYDFSSRDYQIFEISADFKSWSRVTDFYVPVVYINGRGTRYEEARATKYASTEKPRHLESRNMLTSRFKAYFTSDGCSSCFRLPLTGLAAENVTCRVYISPDQYTDWSIGPTATTASATFYTATVTLNVDRAKGMLYFTDKDGDYPIPIMSRYSQNNICITAGKQDDEGFRNAASSTCCAAIGSALLFSGGVDRGMLYAADRDRPLYFPEGSAVRIGGGNKGVEALISCRDKLIAMKTDEVYAVGFQKGEAVSNAALFADDASVFYEKDTFEVKTVSTKIGCERAETCAVCGDTPVWLGTDKRLYALNLSSLKINLLSERIDPYLEQLGEATSAVWFNGYYLLFFGEKAVIMKYESEKKTAFFFWEFGDITVLGGAADSGKLRLFCTGSDGGTLYTACLSGNLDTDICCQSGAAVPTEKSFSATLTTAGFDLGTLTEKKVIDSIHISAASGGRLAISLNGRYFDTIALNAEESDHGCGVLQSIRIMPHLLPVKSVAVTLSSEDGFQFGEMIVYYRMT